MQALVAGLCCRGAMGSVATQHLAAQQDQMDASCRPLRSLCAYRGPSTLSWTPLPVPQHPPGCLGASPRSAWKG